MTAAVDAASILDLNGDVAQLVHDVAERLTKLADCRVDGAEWVAAARAAWEDLPVEIRRQMREFRRYSGPSGMILIRSLLVDTATIPGTPSVAGSVQRSASVTAAVLLMFAAGLGDPVAYDAEKFGALVQNVVPVPGQEEFQSNAGSVPLGFHVENAFHQHRPDYVALLCLRSDHDRVAELKVSCVRRLLHLLAPANRRALCLAEFRTAAPPSFGGLGIPGRKHPVLSYDGEDPDLVVDLEATEPLTPRAREALLELRELFERTALTIRLETGDLAIVDNRVAVHGRTSFRPRYDGMDRWLQRTFIAVDLRKSRACRPGDGYVLCNSGAGAA